MLFITAWLIAMGASELLLWSYGYLYIIAPALYLLLLFMFFYQRRKITKNTSLNHIEKRARTTNLGVVFIFAMLAMLAVAVAVRFFSLIYTGFS